MMIPHWRAGGGGRRRIAAGDDVAGAGGGGGLKQDYKFEMFWGIKNYYQSSYSNQTGGGAALRSIGSLDRAARRLRVKDDTRRAPVSSTRGLHISARGPSYILA
jgi:hypothetical protein